MLLSEMLGVERDVDFGVKGYSVIFKITTFLAEYEYLQHKGPAGLDWREADGATLCIILSGAPANIIHLPPLLTDEQREQLKALYRLGYRYITRSISLTIEAHVGKPRQVMNEWKQGGLHAYVPYVNGGLYGLPIKNETEPYDIAKALGVEE